MPAGLSGVFSAAAGFALVGAGGWFGYAIGSRLIPGRSSSSARLCAAAVAASAAFYGLFVTLLAMGLFDLPIALLLILTMAACAQMWSGGRRSAAGANRLPSSSHAGATIDPQSLRDHRRGLPRSSCGPDRARAGGAAARLGCAHLSPLQGGAMGTARRELGSGRARRLGLL